MDNGEVALAIQFVNSAQALQDVKKMENVKDVYATYNEGSAYPELVLVHNN